MQLNSLKVETLTLSVINNLVSAPALFFTPCPLVDSVVNRGVAPLQVVAFQFAPIKKSSPLYQNDKLASILISLAHDIWLSALTPFVVTSR